MAFHTHRVAVRSSMETLWALLVDKIRHPERYVPGVERVEVLRDLGPHAIERRMHLRVGGHLKPVHELVCADALTHSVLYKLVDDPAYTGWVLNLVHEEAGRLELEYTMHWTSRPGLADVPDVDWQAAIAGAVEHTRQIAEGRDL